MHGGTRNAKRILVEKSHNSRQHENNRNSWKDKVLEK
jgi:hypothetical protein